MGRISYSVMGLYGLSCGQQALVEGAADPNAEPLILIKLSGGINQIETLIEGYGFQARYMPFKIVGVRLSWLQLGRVDGISIPSAGESTGF